MQSDAHTPLVPRTWPEVKRGQLYTQSKKRARRATALEPKGNGEKTQLPRDMQNLTSIVRGLNTIMSRIEKAWVARSRQTPNDTGTNRSPRTERRSIEPAQRKTLRSASAVPVLLETEDGSKM